MAELFDLTLTQAAEAIRRREISAVALAQSLLGRIEKLEPTLKAWVTIDREDVLSAAQQRDDEVETGRRLGPLHGIPIGLKDIFYTAGMKTTACSKIYADFVPTYDATSVTRLKAGRRHCSGEGRHHGVRYRRSFSDRESLEPGPYPGRLKQRLCGSGWQPACATALLAPRPAGPPADPPPTTGPWVSRQPTEESAAMGWSPSVGRWTRWES